MWISTAPMMLKILYACYYFHLSWPGAIYRRYQTCVDNFSCTVWGYEIKLFDRHSSISFNRIFTNICIIQKKFHRLETQ